MRISNTSKHILLELGETSGGAGYFGVDEITREARQLFVELPEDAEADA